jgi:hypothetical protein
MALIENVQTIAAKFNILKTKLVETVYPGTQIHRQVLILFPLGALSVH